MKRKLVAIIIAVLLTGSFVTQVSAGYEGGDRVKELMEEGLNEQEAKQLYRVESIIKTLEEKKCKLMFEDDEYYLSDVNGERTKEKVISEADMLFLTEAFANASRVPHEKMVEDLEKQMEYYPDRAIYRVEYENGSWIQAKCKLVREDEILDETINSYFLNPTYPNEKQISYAYQDGDGTYSYSYEMTESTGVSFSRNLVTESATFSNNNRRVRLNSYHGLQSCGGVISIANASTNAPVIVCDYYSQPQLWCEVANTVVYTTSAALGFNVGPFSFSVPNNYCWSQVAIIRTSIVAYHKYAAYYY